MPDELGRTTENEIAEAVLTVLSLRTSGRGRFEDLFRVLPKVLELTSQDLERSESRPGEFMWQQRLRNITSHKASEGNYIYEGFLQEIDGGLIITDAGRSKAARSSTP
ncbi:hypothetical protein [Neorhizobium petrolearium]|uniref:hypothetical protein n=1 Tax=Neorhizobium petrolearium TaxID=515361 RepID=UPI003F187830